MTVILNVVRRGAYFDSVTLMRVSRHVAALPGVEGAALMVGTPANRQVLRDAGLLAPEGEQAGSGDLVMAVRARDDAAAAAALAEARRLLDGPRMVATVSRWQPRTIRGAVREHPEASLALISVPGAFAAAEARKALRLGLHVMIFSDNVPLVEEVELKREARERGLLVMGPDCGTAIIGGMPLAFANRVPRGDIGIIGASGTGIQEISCLIARAGCGITHAIGTGGRDLKAEVGGLTTQAAIDLLDADAQTRRVVLVSKPPAPEIAAKVLERVGGSAKPFTICFLGASDLPMPDNARIAATLEAAALSAIGGAQGESAARPAAIPRPRPGGRFVRGLFAGGTLCAEAQIVFRRAGLEVASNEPVPGVAALGEQSACHALIDLGADAYTRARPHPMLEPAVRDRPLADALADPSVGAILLDVVLGTGGHPDPAGHLAQSLAGRANAVPVIASVVGTDADPQPRHQQVATLEGAGVIVVGSNAAAARLAVACIENG